MKTSRLIYSLVITAILNLSWSSSSNASPLSHSNDIEEIRYWIAQTEELGIVDRIKGATELLMGRPYVLDNLGEGNSGKYDQDPRYRFDQFDCTTFVETIIALSRAKSFDQFEHHMDRIRYDRGEVNFTTRNHFPSLDWVPNNIRHGYLNEETRRIASNGNSRLETASAIINKPKWYSLMKESMLQLKEQLPPEQRVKRVAEWRDEGKAFQPTRASIDYIPFAEFFRNGQNHTALVNQIPDGSVVNIVRPNWDLTETMGTHMNVSHQMIFVRGPQGQPLLRHASSVFKKVVEQDFFLIMRNHHNHATAKGIHIASILPAPASTEN